MKNVVLLGATGSIGYSTLNVLRQNKEIFTLKAIALHQNLDIEKIDLKMILYMCSFHNLVKQPIPTQL